MSERLRMAYLERCEEQVRNRVKAQPWNKAFHARMKAAGIAYNKRRQERAESE